MILDISKISELEDIPHQKVNVNRTLTLGKNKPKMVVICGVKEDCIIDETGHSVINIWGVAIKKLQLFFQEFIGKNIPRQCVF